MSNYNSLKATIDANIKQNGNQEITGQVLNSVLNQMVTTLGAGYQFAGVATLDPATDPGTPDAKVFYIANGKGTYTNFGGLEVTEDDVVVLYWDSSWHKVSTGIASQAKLSELEGKVNPLKSQVDSNTQAIEGIAASGGASVASAVIFSNGENAESRLGDRSADETQMGYVVLRKGVPFAEQVTASNTIYEIRYDFELESSEDEPLILPLDSVLLFNGGSLIGGYIEYNKTKIKGNVRIYCHCKGNLSNDTVMPQYYGAYGDGEHDDTNALRQAFANKTTMIPPGSYMISESIDVGVNFEHAIGIGSPMIFCKNSTDTLPYMLKIDGGDNGKSRIVLENIWFCPDFSEKALVLNHIFNSRFINIKIQNWLTATWRRQSCGVYMQSLCWANIFKECSFTRLKYGLYGDALTLNFETTNIDHCYFGDNEVCIYSKDFKNNRINGGWIETSDKAIEIYADGSNNFRDNCISDVDFEETGIIVNPVPTDAFYSLYSALNFIGCSFYGVNTEMNILNFYDAPSGSTLRIDLKCDDCFFAGNVKLLSAQSNHILMGNVLGIPASIRNQTSNVNLRLSSVGTKALDRKIPVYGIDKINDTTLRIKFSEPLDLGYIRIYKNKDSWDTFYENLPNGTKPKSMSILYYYHPFAALAKRTAYTETSTYYQFDIEFCIFYVDIEFENTIGGQVLGDLPPKLTCSVSPNKFF